MTECEPLTVNGILCLVSWKIITKKMGKLEKEEGNCLRLEVLARLKLIKVIFIHLEIRLQQDVILS